MALHRLLFDTTDADTRADGAKVGAILYDAVNDRLGIINSDQELLVHDQDVIDALAGDLNVNLQDGAGTDITSTAGALDVNISSGSLTQSDVYDEDAAHSSGDEGGFVLAVRNDTLGSLVDADGDYAPFQVNASGELYVKDSDVLSELQGGLDVTVQNASIEVTQGTDPWVIGDGGNSITVDASQLDIDDLNATDDAVQAWAHDGSGTAITSTGGAMDVNIASSDITLDADDDLANTALSQIAETVGTSAAAILDGADELASRKHVYIYNNDNRAVYLGDSGVTTSDGYPIYPGSEVVARIGDAVDVYLIGEKAGTDVRTLQLS